MATSEAHKRAAVKYQRKNYSVLGYQVRKEKAAEIRKAAADRGLSITRMIDAAVMEYLANHPVVSSGE